jgi:hypothetical protein
MRICKIDLSNFRGIKTGSVVFPSHAVLLGANNTGKSTIAEALAVLAGRERMTRPLSDWDSSAALPHRKAAFISSPPSPILVMDRAPIPRIFRVGSLVMHVLFGGMRNHQRSVPMLVHNSLLKSRLRGSMMTKPVTLRPVVFSMMEQHQEKS